MKKKRWQTLFFYEMGCRNLMSIFLCVFLCGTCFGQNEIKISDIETVRKQYQACLDKGEFMLGCSQNYYRSMDSCLNIVYKQLKQKLDEPSRAALKKEQLAWLKKRDLQFRRIERTIKEEGQDGQMIIQDEKTEVVKERVTELMQKLYQ